ncbi:MAG: hypothetical protein SGJ23_10855 [Alphaproteobacteria bacterium]|nr:hypothetical protein [Alphaproteobacteria bacterium]
MAKKTTKPPVSTLAARGLSKDNLTASERARVYGSALSQDEERGQKKKP